jgi:hypothetical protein
LTKGASRRSRWASLPRQDARPGLVVVKALVGRKNTGPQCVGPPTALDDLRVKPRSQERDHAERTHAGGHQGKDEKGADPRDERELTA